MPLYTYTCREHGEFSAWSAMSASDQPQACPTCATPGPRALARPALGGRSADGDLGGDFGCGADGCGNGMCAPAAPGGHVCGAGCMH